jgi:hypothetical protein
MRRILPVTSCFSSVMHASLNYTKRQLPTTHQLRSLWLSPVVRFSSLYEMTAMDYLFLHEKELSSNELPFEPMEINVLCEAC